MAPTQYFSSNWDLEMQANVEQRYCLGEIYGLAELLLYSSKTKVNFMKTMKIYLHHKSVKQLIDG